MSMQLVLGIAPRDDATFDSFYPGRNAQVVSQLRNAASGGSERFTYLWGSKGAGTSHLLQAACLSASQNNRQSIYLPLGDPILTPEILHDLETVDLICLDDLESVLNDPQWVEALFHLYNRIRDSHATLIIAAKSTPLAIQCSLLDLRSRLAWGLTFQVHGLTDEDKLKALQLRAGQRGFELSREVGLFILRHCQRDMSELYHTLQELDEASLAAKRRLTVPFVKRVLSI